QAFLFLLIQSWSSEYPRKAVFQVRLQKLRCLPVFQTAACLKHTPSKEVLYALYRTAAFLSGPLHMQINRRQKHPDIVIPAAAKLHGTADNLQVLLRQSAELLDIRPGKGVLIPGDSLRLNGSLLFR